MTGQDESDQQCDLLIRNAYVITMDAERRIFTNGAVAVTGAVIVEVGPDAVLGKRYRAERTIDAGGGPVHPGFFDCHAHVSLHITRGAFPDDVGEAEYMQLYRKWMNGAEADDEYASALLASLEMLSNGITYFVEPGTVFEPDAAAAAVERIGMRASLADPYLWDVTTSPIVHGLDRAPASRDRALKLMGQQLARNSNPEGRVRGHVGLYGVATCSDALMLEGTAAAVDNGAILTQHQNFDQSDVEAEDVYFGRHALVHQAEIGVLGPHCLFTHMNYLRDDEVAAVVDSGLAIAWNPGNYLNYGIGSKTRTRVPELYRKGVRVGPASDVAKVWGFGEQGFLSYLVALEKGYFLSAEQILEMATISAAKALGVDDRLGSLESGKRADIVIRTNDVSEARPNVNPIRNLVLVSRSKSVDTVLVDGKIVVEHSRATLVENAAVYELAEVSARRLTRQVGLEPGSSWPSFE